MITLAKSVATEHVVEAIAILCSPVFGALNMANALGGAQTDVWRLVRDFTLAQLIDEAAERGAVLDGVHAACCDVPVLDTPPFHGALEYDPRPRCPLCCRPHFKPNNGEQLSCGNARTVTSFRPHRLWRWSRATAEAAVDGTYTSGGY